MMHAPMLPASALRPILGYLDGVGLPRSPLVERIAARLGDPGLLVPYSMAGSVFQEALRADLGEDLGLRIGGASRTEQLGPFGDRLRWAGVPPQTFRRALFQCALAG